MQKHVLAPLMHSFSHVALRGLAPKKAPVCAAMRITP